ncbi:hypothetical protein BT96DRAFT_295178 [Gymnopus androsaceus JB14]|uniref:Uncharacterized protein n=1 Tax=Gymnopus androsaceus JB14 TaxID=1447944 RepID=A0A6A4I5M8_9AGAR|nr:hypothetical protein BT96DRAFT_295178 [Gymnopus androsaceus JB14]
MVSGDTRSPSGLSGIPSRGTIGQQSLIVITDSTGPRTRLRSNSTSTVQLTNCGQCVFQASSIICGKKADSESGLTARLVHELTLSPSPSPSRGSNNTLESIIQRWSHFMRPASSQYRYRSLSDTDNSPSHLIDGTIKAFPISLFDHPHIVQILLVTPRSTTSSSEPTHGCKREPERAQRTRCTGSAMEWASANPLLAQRNLK